MHGRLTVEAAALLVEFAAAEEQRFVAGLTTRERTEAGSPDRWSARAALAHVTDWKAVQVERMRAHLERREAPDCDGLPFPHRSPDAYAPLVAVPWDGLPERAATVSAELAALTRRFEDDDLVRRFSWTLGKPLAQQLVGRGVWHTLTHLTEHHRLRGRHQEARRLSGALLDLVLQLGVRPVPGDAMGHYNFACLFAAGGRLETARELLREAILIDPSLDASAREDADLAVLAA